MWSTISWMTLHSPLCRHMMATVAPALRETHNSTLYRNRVFCVSGAGDLVGFHSNAYLLLVVSLELVQDRYNAGVPQTRVLQMTHATAQATLPQLTWLVAEFSRRKSGFNSEVGYVGFVVNNVALGQGFSANFGFPVPYIIPPQYPSVIRSWYNGAT